ncbi:MAG: hypothetical protein ACRCT8_17170 [Lacipirellulaceae bacterium]
MRTPLQLLSIVALVLIAPLATADNQTSTITPVLRSDALPYRVELRRRDMTPAVMPSLHSFVAGEHQGEWVVIGGLTNGIHGFDYDRTTLPARKQNGDVWVIDPLSRTTWRRSLDPSDAGSGLTMTQLLSISGANAQADQVGDRLYMTGGYGDDSLTDPTSRNTFSTLTAFDLPGLVDWAKGGSGTAASHIRQTSDPLFKVTGGDMVAVGSKMHLVFGQDYVGRYRPNLSGEYTNQVRSFEIQDDGATLGVTAVSSSTPAPQFRRRDLNVYPSIKENPDGSIAEGITALSGVFTVSNGAWTVPVEIDAQGTAQQADFGLSPTNVAGALDADARVFKQGMNNYHSAKLGMFSEATGEMHQLLFGGITLQEYLPTSRFADSRGFVTDPQMPNTNQFSAVVRGADGVYRQHHMGEFPTILASTGRRMRFGSNAEFFAAEGLPTYANGVFKFDELLGPTTLGYIYGGLTANSAHVFGDVAGLSAASGEVFEVIFIPTLPIPEPGAAVLLVVGLAAATIRARCVGP